MPVENPHKFWPNILSSVFLLLLGVLLSAPFITGSQVPLDTALLTPPPPNVSGDFHQSDQAYAIYPAYSFIVDSSRTDESLLWNPDAHKSGPFLAAWKTRCFSPFTLPFYFMGLGAALALSVLLKLWVAGLAAFYTTRKLSYSPLLSVLCAVTFQCSHAFLAQPIAPFSDALPWVPILFLFAERMYLRQARYWPVGAVTIALMLLSGDWVATGLCLAALTLYVVIHELMYPYGRRSLLTGLSFTLSLVLGLSLITPLLLPYLDYMWDTIPIAASNKSLPGMMGGALLLLPYNGGLRHFGIVHVGTIQCLTMLLWFFMRPSLLEHHRSKIDALQVTSLILLVGTLMYGEFYSDTALATVVSHHQLLLPLSFMMALSSVITLAIWCELTPSQCASTAKLGTVPVLCILAGLMLPGIIPLLNAPIPTSTRVVILLGTLTIILAYYLLLFYSLLRPKSNRLILGFIALTLIDLSLVAQPNQYRSPASTLDHQTAMDIAHSQHVTGRSLEPIDAFMREAVARPELLNLMPGDQFVIPLTTTDPLSPAFRQSLQLQSVTHDGLARFRKLLETPNLQLHDTVRYQETWSSETLDYKAAPIVSNDISLAKWETIPPAPQWISPPQNTTLRIAVNPTAPSVLSVRRMLNDDWVATIDTVETETFQVNGVFTGVVVNPGDEMVELHYRPKSFSQGKIISLLALILVIFGYIRLGSYRTRTTKTHH